MSNPADTHVLTADSDVGNLSEAECLRLLATVSVGRVALTRHALPVVLPVNFSLDGHGVMIRTGAGSLLAISKDQTVIAFEADEFDPVTHAGWSVLLVGTILELTHPSDVLRADQLRIASWAGGEHEHYVRITPGLISGRRVGGYPTTSVVISDQVDD